VASQNYGGIKLLYKEEAPPTFTQAAYRFYEDGTEAGATAIAAQNTNITRDVTSDSSLLLRMRIQNDAVSNGVSTDDWKLQYEKNDSGTWNDFEDSVGGTTDTYYFNASDAGPTDTLGVYTNDANAYNGNTTDYAVGNLDPSQPLTGTGTTAPTSGATINSVKARLYASSGASPSWSNYVTLTAPSGGWTWQKVNDLEANVGAFDEGSTVELSSNIKHSGVSLGVATRTGVTDVGDYRFYKVEIDVTHGAVIPLGVFNSLNLTNNSATTNQLGAGTGSFAAGEIVELGRAGDYAHPGSTYTEHLFTMTLYSAGFNDNDTLDFRLLYNDLTTSMTYTVTPRITVDKPGGGGGNTTNWFQFI